MSHDEPRVLAQDCVARHLIDRHAIERPEALFASFEDGQHWTYRTLRTEVTGCAVALQQLGVQQDQLVLLWLPPGPDALRLLLAVQYLGAVAVPINTAYRGGLLAHVLQNTGAALAIVDGRLADRLADVERSELRQVVVLGPERPALPHVTVHGAERLAALGEPGPPPRPIEGWDTQAVLYTSGTTGPSKGVLSSYLHLHSTVQAMVHVGPQDCNLASLPLFHVGGILAIYMALIHGGSLAMIESFSTSRFWDTVRQHRVTTTGLLGAMVQFLMKQPPSPDERRHPLRSVMVAPLTDDAVDFSARFGVDVYTEYNMTELCMPIFSDRNPRNVASCGLARRGVELRIVDAHDNEVPDGQVGELIVRTARPWQLSHGYLNNPQATASSWRNGWFHTGDAFRRDQQGQYCFVDRLKDTLRRRGENISSFEVEVELLAHPAVREAAVVGVPAAESEDEVLAVLSLVPGATIGAAELINFLRPRLAEFMVPRYIRLLPELPKTPTNKPLKHVLKTEGVTPDTWDREAAGLSVKRQRLAPRRIVQ
jgi:crotonobetaine/carnitine-CoA ligase